MGFEIVCSESEWTDLYCKTLFDFDFWHKIAGLCTDNDDLHQILEIWKRCRKER